MVSDHQFFVLIAIKLVLYMNTCLKYVRTIYLGALESAVRDSTKFPRPPILWGAVLVIDEYNRGNNISWDLTPFNDSVGLHP